MPVPEERRPPAYAIKSVDHALRIAAILQLEGALTVSDVSQRLGVARSTAHRLLVMLVYRDFATQDDDRVYRAGPVLELAAHSQSQTSALRSALLPHLDRFVGIVGETVNLAVRTGDRARFIASVECNQALRVGSREGMVFPAHRTSGGLLMLATLPDQELADLYSEERYVDRPSERPPLPKLRVELAKVRRNQFAVNNGRSERGVVAVGVPVSDDSGVVVAAISVSIPSVRYNRHQLSALVTSLRGAAAGYDAS